MKHWLDKLDAVALALGACGMVATLAMVLASVLARALHLDWPGTDAYAGYAMAAAAFFGLAPTLRRGEHIRVTLLLARLRPAARRRAEIAVHALGLAIAALLAWFACRLVWQSHQFNDVSQGLDATPLWLPQLAMAAGSVMLLLALCAGLAAVWRGELPRDAEAPARSE